jgi:hypothetical protein
MRSCITFAILLALFTGAQCGYAQSTSSYVINLGDYAKGDGSDETAAIQRAIDAIPSRYNWPDSDPKQGGVLYIPRPNAFYGISKTLDFSEKWNITVECESPAVNTRMAPTPMYFKWIGAKGDQPMFSFNTVMGARVINLSLDGRNAASVAHLYEVGGQAKAKALDPAYGAPQAEGLVGVFVGPSKEQEIAMGTYPGIARMVTFQNLTIKGCAVGMWVGGTTKQSDTASLSARDVVIGGCSQHGLVVNSTMAVMQFDNLLIDGSGISNVQLYGGDIGFTQYVGTGSSKTMTADIDLQGGGLRIFGAWSETYAPFIKSHHTGHMYPTMPRVIIGAVHGSPAGGKMSIDYDYPTALNLIGCGFRNDVILGPKSGPVMAMGVTFGNPRAGFGGEGVTKYGRLIRIGDTALESNDPSRAIVWGLTPRDVPDITAPGATACWNDPYLVDRRSTPGVAPPTTGVWAKGDRILNVDPDPAAPEKAWAGWICIQAGEPGTWKPFGAIGQ